MAVSLFVSDLHLCAERPQKIALFYDFLHAAAHSADALYFLGDVFEAWAGDDDKTPPHAAIILALARYASTGRKLYLMRGNRDYLMGSQFAEETGGELLEDVEVILINGERVLLMHGDTLCSGDVRYQIFRRIVNNGMSKALFLKLPYILRSKIWHRVRKVARQTAKRRYDFAEVCQTTVEKAMRHAQTYRLIHGHTHRQGIHHFTLDGQTATRTVLGDWLKDGSVLVADDDGFRLVDVARYIREIGTSGEAITSPTGQS